MENVTIRTSIVMCTSTLDTHACTRSSYTSGSFSEESFEILVINGIPFGTTCAEYHEVQGGETEQASGESIREAVSRWREEHPHEMAWSVVTIVTYRGFREPQPVITINDFTKIANRVENQ